VEGEQNMTFSAGLMLRGGQRQQIWKESLGGPCVRIIKLRLIKAGWESSNGVL
jgi:hypothetical protein